MHVSGIRDDVEHRRSFLRLGDERGDIVGRRVRVDVEVDPNGLKSVSNVSVNAENSRKVHVALNRRFRRSELDSPILRDRGHTRHQAACERSEDDLDRRRALIGGREKGGVVGVDYKSAIVLLFFAKAMEAMDCRTAMDAIPPFAGGAPRELRALRFSLKRRPGVKDRLNVHTVLLGGDNVFSHRVIFPLV